MNEDLTKQLRAIWNRNPEGEANDIIKSQAAEIERLTRQMDALNHAANEFADALVNSTQWIKNIRDGVSTPEQALLNLADCTNHCTKVWLDSKSAIANVKKESEHD